MEPNPEWKKKQKMYVAGGDEVVPGVRKTKIKELSKKETTSQ